MTDLENRYRAAQESEEAVVAKIKKACAAFMATTPDFYATPENERRMFQTMEQNDQLSPTSVGGWSECFAICREQLQPRPRRERSAPTSTLTHAEVDSWSAIRMQKEIESSPRREQEIEAALARR